MSGNATATAERIAASEFLWRVGIAGEFLLLICAVALTLIFYVLLKPVSRDLALLATLFNLVSIAIEAVSGLDLIATLFPLANADYLNVFDSKQRAALAYLTIRSHADGFGVALIFLGCVCLILGYLIFRSGYLPRIIGVLMQIAGLCYLTNSFALILSRPSRTGSSPRFCSLRWSGTRRSACGFSRKASTSSNGRHVRSSVRCPICEVRLDTSGRQPFRWRPSSRSGLRSRHRRRRKPWAMPLAST